MFAHVLDDGGYTLVHVATRGETALEPAVVVRSTLPIRGPVVRGDTATVERNLQALAERSPAAVAPYVALSRAAADLAERSGRLNPAQRAAIEEVLARWT